MNNFENKNELFKNWENFKEFFQKRCNFNILVIATMSAGKSSFINAMIGEELLHSANEATTACITSIEKKAGLQGWKGTGYSLEGQELSQSNPITNEILREWNVNPKISLIRVCGGGIEKSSLTDNLVIYDTPGPNNSQNIHHSELMLNALKNVPFNAICYVLNAGQIGTCDDNDLMKMIYNEVKNKPNISIYFILNKVDLLDEDKGEYIEKFVENVQSYVKSIGFEKSIIIPMVADITLIARKALNNIPLRSREKKALDLAREDLVSSNRSFLKASFVPHSIKRKIMVRLNRLERSSVKKRGDVSSVFKNDLKRIVALNGVSIVESLIHHQHKKIESLMNIIEITHNPFTIETTFMFNGCNPAERCKLSSYKDARLQIWVGRLFEELSVLFNGDNNFHVVFKGVEADYMDIEAAAQNANNAGMNVELEWVPVEPAEAHLEKRCDLLGETDQTLKKNVAHNNVPTVKGLIHHQDKKVKLLMNNIEITHNPFVVETTFLFNGHSPAEGCKLSSYRETRLQIWVEQLFAELSSLFNGDNNFHVVFKGVEADYMDIEAAAQNANNAGMNVELEWVPVEPAEARLEKIHSLIEEARQNPTFNQFLENNEQVRSSLKEAFNRDFDVYVVATMSSGKSTLINAMLGCDLLPSANEATTATITRIADNDQMGEEFRGVCYNNTGEKIAEKTGLTLEHMKDWNSKPDVKRIDIEGNILAIREREDVRLVLTDTPGPNNSQDEDHQRITMKFIQDSKRNPLIIYILNATQLGTNDDRNLLNLIAESMKKGGKQSKDRFIFVVNKMDMFDPENGEDISSILDRVKKYLIDNNISNPLVYPVSANLARLIRKPSDLHTRSERGEFAKMADLFSEEPSMDMLQYMPITPMVRRSLEVKGYSDLLLRSGLPAVETMIDEYIDKYNLPHRIKRAYDAIKDAVEVGLHEAKLVEQLDQDQHILDHLNEEISELEKRQKNNFDAIAYKDRLAQERKILPPETEERLSKLEDENRAKVREIGNMFQKRATDPSEAENLLRTAENNLKFYYKKSINNYNDLIESTQELVRNDLSKEYNKYINELFEEKNHFNMPVLEGLKHSLGNISINTSLRQDEIKERKIITGSKEVDDSRWWNPFSWGSTKTVYEYGKKKEVYLDEIWEKRLTSVKTDFKKLVEAARERVNECKDILVDDYLKFMDKKFNSEFQKLIDSLKEKTTDKATREKAIAEAKKEKIWIQNFKSDLDDTLTVEKGI